MKPIAFPLFASTARGFRASSTIALTCALLLGSAALSQAGILVSESFDTDGALNGQNGGTGFSTAWSNSTGVNVSGGAVVTAGGNNPSFRNLSTAFGNSGTLWVSFDWGHNSGTVGYGGLTLWAGATAVAEIGDAYNGTWQVVGAGASSTSALSSMKTGVAKITLGAGATSTIELWVGPTGSPVDVSGSAVSTLSGLSLEGVDNIRIMGDSAQSFDNLIIGTTVADVDAIDPTPASGTWTNMAGGTWGTTGNWLGNIVATGTDSTADFNTLNLTADTTVDLDSARTIGNLLFGDTDTSSAAGWTLTGSALTLSGTTPTITVNALGGTKTVAISAAVAGAAGLTKAGPGTLILTGANTYSGDTTISAGTLNIGNGGNSGSLYSAAVPGGNLTFGSAGAIENNSALAYNLAGGYVAVNQTISGTGTLSVTGDQSVHFAAGTSITTDGSQTYSATATGGRYYGFNLADAATVTLTSTAGDISMTGYLGTANESTGNLFIDTSAGNGNITLNTPTGMIGVDYGMNSLSADAGTGAITLGTYNGQDWITCSSVSLTGGTINSTANLTDFTTLAVTNSGASTFSGDLTASGGSLIKDGTGTLALTGAATYGGGTTVNQGTLILGDGTNNVGLSDTSDLIVESGTTLQLDYDAGSPDSIDELWLGGVQQNAGTYGAGTYSGVTITGTGTLHVLNGPITDPFANWMATNYPAIVSPNNQPGADPDNDGIANLLEYVLQGGNPSVSTTGTLPTLDASGVNFVFTYFRRAAATGTTETFEYSTTLGAGSWTPVAIPGGAGVAVTPNSPSAGIDKVEITVAKGANPKLFGRLQVVK